MQTPPLRVGLFGIGLDTYWPQFAGLEEALNRQLHEIGQQIAGQGTTIIHLGLIDNVEKAFEAGRRCRVEDVDLLLLYVSTYALSSTVLPVVQRAKVPVIVLNLSPDFRIDYTAFNALNDRTAMTGEWLRFCNACPLPEIANVFRRSGLPFFQVTGMLRGDEEAWSEIRAWIKAAGVAKQLHYNRLGCMGHYYGGMLDIYTDFTSLFATFGGHIELIEVDELAALRKAVSKDEWQKRLAHFYSVFDIQADCAKEELENAAVTSVALDRLVDKYSLGALAYYYKGSPGSENEEAVASIILGNSLLTANGVPVAGEYEIKNAVAMKIMDSFGAGGSFTEFYAMDYEANVVLMGHDGPGHLGIAEGKTKVRPLKVYHGKVGRGVSVEMSVRKGPVTLLSVVEKGDRFMLLTAEGESVPGPILQIGNTNSRYQFPEGARRFVTQWSSYGPAHHCAVGLGHISNQIEKLGSLLNLEVVTVC